MSTKAKTGLAFQNGQVNYVDGITSADLTAIVGGTGKDFSLYGLTEPGNIKVSDDKTVSLKTLLTFLASQGGGSGTGGGSTNILPLNNTFTGANTFNTGITTIQNLKITDNTINYGTNNTPLDLSTLGSSNVKLTPVAGTTATGSTIKTVSIPHNQGATFKTAPTFKTFIKLQASGNKTLVVPEGIYGVEVTDTNINISVTNSAIKTFCTDIMGLPISTSSNTVKVSASTTMFSAVVFK